MSEISIDNHKEPSLLQALIPVSFLTILLFINVWIFGSDSLDGSNQMVLLLASAVAGIVAIRLGVSWSRIEKKMVGSISSAMPSIIILLLIGSLSGTWMLSGIVPTMIYYGLQILNPTIFLFAAVVICAVVSIATGSSWSTIATIGIALLGIGRALGMSDGIIAGAIISGAYFGDKMSPLSDTTNLAPAMAGTDLFTHIRYMAYTTGPSIILTLIIFLVIGFTGGAEGQVQEIAPVLAALDGTFNISVWLFLVPVVIIVMIAKKVPATPALLIGTLLGAIFALVFQGHLVSELGKNLFSPGESFNFPFSEKFTTIMMAMYGDISITTANEPVNELLSTSGMAGMLHTIWLILSAMIFGGVMESAGLLKRIAKAVISLVNSTGSLIAATTGTCVFFNLTASDQYLAIVVPGRMYADIYQKRGLMPENLSRTVEDSGTVTSVLIPWNTCGATQSSVLGVATFTYAPYCFFNIISPFMTLLFGYMGWKIRKIKEEKAVEKAQAA
ncbi:MAG: Na+/H+ antiporter NhaC [Cyclobacteriaceae bacterium]